MAPLGRGSAVIRKGDHIIYSVTGHVGTAKVQGAMGIKFVRVKDDEYIVDVLPKGVPFLKRARLTFPFDGVHLADLGGVLAGWSVRSDGTRMGEETVPTPFGERTVVRYQRIELKDNGNVQTEQFVDPVHDFPYAARMSGHSGEVQFGIIETSLAWVKGG